MSLKAYISKSFYDFSMNSFMKLMIKCMHLEHTLTKKKKNSATIVLYNRDDGEWKRVFLTFIANKE